MNALAPAPVPTGSATPFGDPDAVWTQLLEHLARELAREYVRLMEQTTVGGGMGDSGIASR